MRAKMSAKSFRCAFFQLAGTGGNVVTLSVLPKWEGGHFIFWKESFGPLRVNHCFAFVDAAKIDKDNGQYYQIGIIKYAFLGY